MRIAILGCDSSHTEEYTRTFLSRGVCVSIYWDPDPQVAKNKQQIYGVGKVIVDLEDAISNADLIMIEGRYGDSHFLPAREALLKGKRVYIDKPATINALEAKELARIADERRAVLRSFSPIISDSNYQEFRQAHEESSAFLISSPAFCWTIHHEKARDISFYSSHATDLLSNLIREVPVKVEVTTNDKGVWVDVFYASGRRGVINLVDDADEFYKVISISGINLELLEINPFGDMYERTADFILGTFSEQEWLLGQFDQAVVSMHMIDEIRLKAGARAWKK